MNLLEPKNGSIMPLTGRSIQMIEQDPLLCNPTANQEETQIPVLTQSGVWVHWPLLSSQTQQSPYSAAQDTWHTHTVCAHSHIYFVLSQLGQRNISNHGNMNCSENRSYFCRYPNFCETVKIISISNLRAKGTMNTCDKPGFTEAATGTGLPPPCTRKLLRAWGLFQATPSS